MLNQHEKFQFWIAKSNNLDSVYKKNRKTAQTTEKPKIPRTQFVDYLSCKAPLTW